jgi:primary-amine oxidase
MVAEHVSMTRTHPLTPLSANEIERVVAAIRASQTDAAGLRFVQVDLLEPPKAALLAMTAGSGPIPERIALAVLFDRASHEAAEVRVSLDRDAVIGWDLITEGFPPLVGDDYELAMSTVIADPNVRAALAKRGITAFERVFVEPWTAGRFPDEAAQGDHGLRLTRCLFSYRDELTDMNPWAHPIENLEVLFDLDSGRIHRLMDYGAVPMPSDSGEFGVDRVGSLRDGLKPLMIHQPDGASFSVDGQQVRWDRWSFYVGFNAREGLTLHELSWVTPEGRVRPVLYRGSLAEMVVPYGDPHSVQIRKNAFDVGEYLIGKCANSLELGCDCLGVIHYFDATMVSHTGEPVHRPRVVCLHEEDYGVLWKHTDDSHGRAEVRRSRRLVVSMFSTVGNYDYGFFWYLYQDGRIEVETKLTGILSTGSVFPGERSSHRQRLTPGGLAAPIHQHLFNFRLDFDVDGPINTVVEEHAEPDPPGEGNDIGAAFHTVATTLETESGAQRLTDSHRARTWRVTSPATLNAVGEPTAYRLIPHANVLPFWSPGSSIAARAAFANRHLWVTAHADDERYPAGEYPNQHPGGAGLPTWTAVDRSIVETDVVLWYTLGTHHSARLEDWPVMPTAYTGFTLLPDGFFDRNPALDVPPASPAENHSVLANGDGEADL